MKFKNLNSWIKDKQDKRDFKYGSFNDVPLFKFSFPKSIDLRSYLSPIEDQLQLNSCTANAIATFIEKENKKQDVSRLFLYYEGRKKSNIENRDDGAYFRDVLKAAKEGVCLETLWEYNETFVNKTPDKKAYENRIFKINGYQRLSNKKGKKAKEIYHALTEGKIIVFGTTLFKSFIDCTNTVYIKPKFSEKIEGYHALAIVGFNRKTNQCLIRNSWGNSWAFNGYVWMDLNYLLDTKYNDDFWCVF